jgi:hypothetical protein
MTKILLEILGTMLVVLGVAGFVSPEIGGVNLTLSHNLLLIAAGVVALACGLEAPDSAARIWSWALATLFGLLGVAGFLLGEPGTVADSPRFERYAWELLDDELEFGGSDHLLHLVVSAAFAVVAWICHRAKPSEQASAGSRGK